MKTSGTKFPTNKSSEFARLHVCQSVKTIIEGFPGVSRKQKEYITMGTATGTKQGSFRLCEQGGILKFLRGRIVK